MEAHTGRIGKGRRRFGSALAGALVLGGWVAVSPALSAQEPGGDPGPVDQEEECVCLDLHGMNLDRHVDAERIRRQLRRSLDRAERARRRSFREVEGVRSRLERIADLDLPPRGRARLGVEIRPDQPDDPDARGVRIVALRPEGPATEAGLEEGDTLVAVNGQSLVEPLPDGEEEGLDPEWSLPAQRLTRILASREPGDTVRVTYLRGGEEAVTPVVLDARRPPRGPRPPRAPRPFGQPGLVPGAPGTGWGPLAGLRLQTLGPELGEYFGTDRGALVLDVTEESTFGLRPGDVVLGVGERRVEDVDDFRRIVRSYEEGEEISFRIRREGRDTTVTGAAP